jgi:hypothetical protein
MCARWASTIRSGGIIDFLVHGSPSPFRERAGRGFKAHLKHGMDAAARSRQWGGAAENAKGVFL